MSEEKSLCNPALSLTEDKSPARSHESHSRAMPKSVPTLTDTGSDCHILYSALGSRDLLFSLSIVPHFHFRSLNVFLRNDRGKELLNRWVLYSFNDVVDRSCFKINCCWIAARVEGDLLYGGLELLTQDSKDRDNVITKGLYCWAFKTDEAQALDTGVPEAPSMSFPSRALDGLEDF